MVCVLFPLEKQLAGMASAHMSGLSGKPTLTGRLQAALQEPRPGSPHIWPALLWDPHPGKPS